MKLILQKKVRECCDVSLAWWHRVKWATKMIMCVFATDFIAPLFHEFFFFSEFCVDKMGLPSQTCILSYIGLAHPSFWDQL
jgi:hypothetical protein